MLPVASHRYKQPFVYKLALTRNVLCSVISTIGVVHVETQKEMVKPGLPVRV